MKKTILFDVYGTLISTGNGSVTAAERILRKNGSNLDATAFYARWKELHKCNMLDYSTGFRREREIFQRDLKQLYEMYDIKGDAEQDVCIMLESLYNRVVFPETIAALEELSAYYELVIASNTDTEPLLQNFKYNGLKFAQIFTSESLGCYKPDVRFYTQIAGALQKKPEELIFVGDSLREDVLVPKELGMGGVLIDRKGLYRKERQADLVLERLPTVAVLQCVFL